MRAHLDPDNLPAGEMVDSWRVVRRLGGGAYGTTYLVEKGGDFFAMKVARHREQSGDERLTDERTLRELSCLLALRHRHIARVWAHGRWPHPTEGFLYLVMDYVEGYTLSQWKEAVCPTPHEVVVLVEKVMGAVAYMHALGILHRDLKPDNLLVGKDGEPVVVDYGAAHFPVGPPLTKRGLPPGTPRYTSPEATRFDLAHRHDKTARYQYTVPDELYALGVTLYDLLTDPWPCTRPEPLPVGGSNPPDYAHEVNERVPVALSLFTAKLLERDPNKRPESMEKARRQVAEFASLAGEDWVKRPVHPPPPLTPASSRQAPARSLLERLRERWRLALGAGVGLGVVLAGVYLALHGATPEPVPLPASPSVAEKTLPRAPAAPSSGTPTPSGLAPADAPTLEPAPALALPPTSPQEKGPTVKARSAPTLSSCLQQAPPRGSPAWRAWCQCAGIVGTLAALQAGCTGPQVRPASEPCPQEVLDAYAELETRPGEAVDVQWNRGQGGEHVWVKFGPLTSVVTGPGSGKLTAGSLLFGELKLTDPEEGTARARFTLAQLPNGKKYPVCIAAVIQNYGHVKEGAIEGRNGSTGAIWERWRKTW
ncbi:serine/threonine protein kinase [Hyalangium versicolor]|uniref:serine/threonine protein kinase n=1 Tax=Hyalangium versicolor TaxID=2861190 RepID=UPI001CCC1257|nr:serine/threonine-protein kinase [Hyalangium versicolor]